MAEPGSPPTEPLIAIVDDDQSVGEALRRMLRTHGFATAVFGSAEQFLDFSHRDWLSCLILDVRLPAMTGLALHDYLVGQGCRLPTILITACPTNSEKRRALVGGATSYLAKPLNEEVLLDNIRKALKNREQATGGN